MIWWWEDRKDDGETERNHDDSVKKMAGQRSGVSREGKDTSTYSINN